MIVATSLVLSSLPYLYALPALPKYERPEFNRSLAVPESSNVGSVVGLAGFGVVTAGTFLATTKAFDYLNHKHNQGSVEKKGNRASPNSGKRNTANGTLAQSGAGAHRPAHQTYSSRYNPQNARFGTETSGTGTVGLNDSDQHGASHSQNVPSSLGPPNSSTGASDSRKDKGGMDGMSSCTAEPQSDTQTNRQPSRSFGTGTNSQDLMAQDGSTSATTSSLYLNDHGQDTQASHGMLSEHHAPSTSLGTRADSQDSQSGAYGGSNDSGDMTRDAGLPLP